MSDIQASVSRDFYYYRRLTYDLPIGLLVAILAAGLIILLLTAIGRRLVIASAKNSYKNFPWQIRFLLDGIRDLTFRITGFLLFEFEHDKATQEHKYFLYGVPVHLFVLQYLFVVLLTIISVSALTFWNTFLAETTINECDTQTDCFPIHSANETPIQVERIANCDDFPVSENVTILCFRLVYQYSEGLGESGGFLFSMQVITNALIYIVVRMIRSVLKLVKILKHRNPGQETSEEELIKKIRCISIITKVISVTLVLVFYCAIIVLLPLWLFYDRAEFRATLRTPQRLLQLFLYAYNIFVLFLVPPIVGGGIYNIQLYENIEIELYRAHDLTVPPNEDNASENNRLSEHSIHLSSVTNSDTETGIPLQEQ